MTYLALYRAWRPQKFEDVVGQEHITKTLQNALRESRFSHAYLFTGPRGTGKTSTAKILAKAINCKNDEKDEPCNQCATCMGITDGSILDVVEIDAASNRGIEEIRELREKARFAPTETKYKVYIIDEVHMLTTEAFNALLKTLEEPPAHVIFVLATTEPHKLPLTIISRCQRFDFRRITTEKMLERLQKIVKAEHVNIEDTALSLIAKHSEGGMRDALSLLDQISSYGGESITDDDVLKITGRVSQQIFSELADSIYKNDAVKVLNIIDQLIQEGKDPEKILEDMLYYYRDLLLFKSAPTLEEIEQKVILDHNIPKVAKSYNDSKIYQIIEILNKYLMDIKRTNQSRIILELALIKITKLITEESQNNNFSHKIVDELKEKLAEVENKLEKISKNQVITEKVSQESQVKSKPSVSQKLSDSQVYQQLNGLKEKFSDDEYQRVIEVWPKILQIVKEQKVTVHAWLIDGEPVAVADNKIFVAFNNAMHRDTTNKQTNRQLIEDVLFDILGEKYSLFNIMQKEWKAFEGQFEKELQKDTKENENDSILNKAYEMFGKDLVEIKD